MKIMKKTIVAYLGVILLLCAVSATLIGQTSIAQADTSTPGYGAEVNPTGNPIGGGAGYSNIITSGDYTVTSRTEFLAALSTLSGMSESARTGKIIYIEESANIDMGGGTYGTLSLAVPSGITIASNRGLNGSPGGRIYWSLPTTLPHYKHFLVVGNNVTFSGIRLQGPDGAIGTSGSDPLIDGIYCSGKTGLVVGNCEIYNWPYAGIAYYSDKLPGLGSPSQAYIHHNYVHNCRRLGLGYGVQVAAASALIEANLFDYCRHAIGGERDYPTSNYEARFNIVEPNITNSMFDMHGGNDTPSWGFADGPDPAVPAGGTILIHHNTFKSSSQISVGIRGVPADVCRIYNNWTYWPSSASTTTFLQRLENLGLTPYVNMQVYDNWYGTTPPPLTNHSPLLGAIGDKTVNGGEALTFTVEATDPDGDALTYSASNLPQGASFDPATWNFSWTPTSDQAGVYPNVRFQVSDGSLTDSEDITITVNSVVQPPLTNHSPLLGAIGDKTVNGGEALTFTVEATDPDGDALTYSASNLPQGASFDPATRTFSWTPINDQAGVYPNVGFQVSDGSLNDSEDITITVNNVVQPDINVVQPDINGDGAINVLDMIRIGQHWNEVGQGGWIEEDVNEDGTVNVLDATLVGQHWTE
jgi:hypothetical protein